jgi:hypothetical protein
MLIHQKVLMAKKNEKKMLTAHGENNLFYSSQLRMAILG